MTKDLIPNSLVAAEAAVTSDELKIEQLIFTVRGQQVMLDRDLARLYGVEISQMNRQVKRNIERFPEDFMFQLTSGEWASLKCQIGISKTRGGDRHLPYAFTEQGVAALSGILRSSSAIQVNIRIVRAFVAMRRYISANAGMFQRIESLERKQIETDLKIDRVLACHR